MPYILSREATMAMDESTASPMGISAFPPCSNNLSRLFVPMRWVAQLLE